MLKYRNRRLARLGKFTQPYENLIFLVHALFLSIFMLEVTTLKVVFLSIIFNKKISKTG